MTLAKLLRMNSSCLCMTVLFAVGMMRQVEDSYVLQRSLDVISKWSSDNRMQLLENTFPSQVHTIFKALFEEACLGTTGSGCSPQ